MVKAGEAGGSLEVVLERLAENLERTQALRETVRSALQYPALVVLLAIGSLVILMTKVVPEFRPLFDDAGAALPVSTQVIIAISDFPAGLLVGSAGHSSSWACFCCAVTTRPWRAGCAGIAFLLGLADLRRAFAEDRSGPDDPHAWGRF